MTRADGSPTKVMKVRRRLLNLLTALSLLLCVAVCVLWVRSYWVAYHFTGDRKYSVRYLGGGRPSLTPPDHPLWNVMFPVAKLPQFAHADVAMPAWMPNPNAK